MGRKKFFASPQRNDAGEKMKMFINNMAKNNVRQSKKRWIKPSFHQPRRSQAMVDVYKKQIIAIMTN